MSTANPRYRTAAIGLLLASYALFAIAWAVTDPPGAAPDEGAHYVKAVAAGRGHLRGSPPPPLAASEAGNPAAVWIHRTSRVFPIAGGLAPSPFACVPSNPVVSAACLTHPPPAPARPTRQITYVGTYQPALYILPGLATLPVHTTRTALILARLANALLSLVLIGAAAWLLWERSAFQLVGLLGAVTPMAIFLAATPSASGPETAAALCVFASVMVLTRAVEPGAPSGAARGRAWAVLAVGGVVLGSARPLSPLWVAAAVVLFVWLSGGPRPAWRRLREGGRTAAIATTLIAAAVVLNLGWEMAFQPGGEHPVTLSHWTRGLGALPRVLHETVGVFASLTVHMPQPAYVGWGLMAVALVLGALVFGRRSSAVLVIGLLAGGVVTTVVVEQIEKATGFGNVQGRYVLPLAVAIPIVAAEVLSRSGRTSAVAQRGLVLAFALIAAAVHVEAWYQNSRDFAVGKHGGKLFFRRPAWSPWGGWWPWLLVVGVAAGALALFGLLGARLVPSEGAAPALRP
ncbi:MAG: DUF2142 domain-containing protein [Acidimicrobiia bacterium]|nr:DUF2142 domain-containing protein [Acidimicrobiia bacterium]